MTVTSDSSSSSLRLVEMCSNEGCGLQCVTTTGLWRMLLSSVESWDTGS